MENMIFFELIHFEIFLNKIRSGGGHKTWMGNLKPQNPIRNVLYRTLLTFHSFSEEEHQGLLFCRLCWIAFSAQLQKNILWRKPGKLEKPTHVWRHINLVIINAISFEVHNTSSYYSEKYF